MTFAYLKGDVQSPTREQLVCTIGLEGTRTYTSEGALVIPPGTSQVRRALRSHRPDWDFYCRLENWENETSSRGNFRGG